MPSWELPAARICSVNLLHVRVTAKSNGFRQPQSAARSKQSARATLSPTQIARYVTEAKDIAPFRKQLKDEAKAKRSAESSYTSKPSIENQKKLKDWELTVGIEIHAQLNTARKLFSHAATSTNEKANTHVALFDVATPGSLPIFQKATLIPALRAAIALRCTVQRTSRFDRKHYFYHDQPAGYQLTQYYKPFAKDGGVTLTPDDGIGPGDGDSVAVGIKQVQMEQDTAKSQESEAGTYLMDFNRAGQALIEIISLPQIHSPEAAAAYVRKVQAILLSVNAVTTGMEMGGLRADVNVSVRHREGPPGNGRYSGITGLGQRTEIKNLSSLKGVEEAIKAEWDRQISILEAGGTVEGETRGWSLAAPTVTRKLRGKEGEVDYRYMPDPDIAPIIVGDDVIDHLRRTLPKLPDQILATLTEDDRYGLSMTDAKILLQLDDGERLEYYISVVERLNKLCQVLKVEGHLGSIGKLAANWVTHELGALLTTSQKSWDYHQVPPAKLALILANLMSRAITGSSARQVLKRVFDGDEREVDVIIRNEGLVYSPLSQDDYNHLAMTVMAQHDDKVKLIREKGQTGKLMFLVGQMMRAGEEGRLDAKRAESILRHLILKETPSTAAVSDEEEEEKKKQEKQEKQKKGEAEGEAEGEDE